METIVGLIPDEAHMKSAERELREAGIPDNKMHVLPGSAKFWNNLCSREKARLVFKDALIGALIGLSLGSFVGVIAGALNCRLMDCPIGTSLIFLVLITLYGALAGTLFGTWIGLDRAEHSLLVHIADTYRDQAILLVETPAESMQEARHVLEHHGTLVDVSHEEVERIEEQGLEP
jgi:hypothetical protein